jgi:dynein heavy chain, axonemal
VQGISTTHPKSIPDSNNLIKLWYHECMRVFHDRLTTVEDRAYLHNLLVGHFTSSFNIVDKNPEHVILDQDRIIFADFMQGRDTDPKYYQQVMDLGQLLNRMDVYQEEYNSDTTFVFGGS